MSMPKRRRLATANSMARMTSLVRPRPSASSTFSATKLMPGATPRIAPSIAGSCAPISPATCVP